jgi:hypothetical protein
VLKLRQVGAEIAAPGKAVNGLPSEPYCRKQQEDARGQPYIQPERRLTR